MFQLYALELAVVNVFGQVPEFQTSQLTDFLRAIKTLATLSHRNFSTCFTY